MLLNIIKKAHQKMVLSLNGILSIISLLLPVALIVVGIVLCFNPLESNPSYGYLWIGLGIFCILFSFRKFKDFFGLIKFIFHPEQYELVKNMTADGKNLDDYEEELKEADPMNKLNKDNPLMFTENFIIGYNGFIFFILMKDDIMWAYEYNGNGIVFMDKHKTYGFTFFPKVDDNDHVMEKLKEEMPYIYLGIDFDYKTIMHDDFDNTVILIENEKAKFLANPETYRTEKEEKEKARIEEEARKLEEEKNAELSRIEEAANEKIDKTEDNEEQK